MEPKSEKCQPGKHCAHVWRKKLKEHGAFAPEEISKSEQLLFRCCHCGQYSIEYSIEWTQEEPTL